MKELLTNYSLSEIILFLILAAVAVKQVISFFDWARKRIRQEVKEKDKPDEVFKLANKHEEQLLNIKHELDSLKEQISLLIESNRDDIKQSITKDHHYFCYKLGSIDDYSLDCVEKRYSHYREEGGNSFVKTLMQDMRALPRKLETNNR